MAMSLIPCPHLKMMGRGPDGGCGTQEKRCPMHRPANRTPTPDQTLKTISAIDFNTQAQKALTERSPFDVSEESLSRIPTLPVALSDFLSRKSGDNRRRKHKKAHFVPGAQGASINIWIETEDYFRPVTLEDIGNLASKLKPASVSDSCFLIPSLQPKSSVEGNLVSAGAESCENVVQTGSLEPVNSDAELKNEEQEMDIDGVNTNGLPEKEPENNSSSSLALPSSSLKDLHWLLGSKHKVLLTSERPSKKRKLLGEDAGLEKLVVVNASQGGDSVLCDVCCLSDCGDQSNQFIHCESCNTTVHQNCYGVRDFPRGRWLCSWCKQHGCLEKPSLGKPAELPLKPCLLCPKEGGALKPVGGDVDGSGSSSSVKFAHLFCSLWMPEVYVESTEAMEPILNVGEIKGTRRKLVCYLCKEKYGICIRCSHGICRTAFHPICARLAKLRMEIWGKIGYDHVELRAFCSKHFGPQDAGSSPQSEALVPVTVGGDSSAVKLLPMTISVNKLPKIKLALKPRDKNTAKDKEGFVEVSKNETQADDAKLRKDRETPKVTERDGIADISSCDYFDVVLILKKLVEQGKVNISHAALEMGIPSNLLTSILEDEQASISSELQLKVIKWLQNSAYIAASMQCTKFGGNTTDSVGAKVSSSSNAVKETGSDGPVAAPVKTFPLRRRMKNNTRNSKGNKMIFTSGETFAPKNGNGVLVDEVSVNPLIKDDMKNDGTCIGSAISHKEHSHKGPDAREKILPETSGPCVSNSSLVGQWAGNEGVSTEMANMSEMQQEPQPILDKVFPLGSGNDQEAEADVTRWNNSTKSAGEYTNVVTSVLPSMPDIKNEESPSSSYIHPFINERLMQVRSCECFKQENRIPMGDDQKEKGTPLAEATCSSRICHKDQSWYSTRGDVSCTIDAARGEQLVKARKEEILELSPEDEVEGEILYFQNRLLDNALASNHCCEELILRVVTNLPHELDALRKQRWDAVVANQFLCEVREAKKQGRKERRHREAQAVLAAATAAAASSSRISSLRKDVHDEIITAYPERTVKASSISGRLSRAKDMPSRLTVPKQEQNEIFQLSSDVSKENPRSCDICRRSETVLNPILVCCGCKVAVHLGCYRDRKDSVGPWYCELCEESLLQCRSPTMPSLNARERSSFIAECGLCGGSSGAFRKSTDGQWVHAFCAEWVLESTFRRGQPNLVEGMETIASQRDMLVCCLCYRKHGVCIKCHYGNCQSAFHPICAKNAGLYMSVRSLGGRFHHKAYCEKHSLEQRDKAEAQQHGAEELQSIRRIRVELEKVRLLCERIIKREKLKRELVLCSHDILASKRDLVAFSVLVRSSFIPPEVSSESVTTSLKGHTDDNRSCSEAIHRSEDTAVDSTVSGKRRAKHPPPTDIDSSTSQWPSMRKPTERAPFSGKQLPLRSAAAAASRNSADDGEMRKSRKHTETFQKELVMTSDQAMTYNMLLPKGYAYVPRTCLPMEKPAGRDVRSHEASDPDG